MERMTDGKPVPSNPISGAKLLEGEPSMHLYLLSRNQNNEEISKGGSPARLRPYVVQINRMSFYKGKRVSTTRRKELTGHWKRDPIAEKNAITFSNWDKEKGMWGSKANRQVRMYEGQSSNE